MLYAHTHVIHVGPTGQPVGPYGPKVGSHGVSTSLLCRFLRGTTSQNKSYHTCPARGKRH